MAALSAVWSMGAVAHPGSGIVVDAKGRVYFTDTRDGIRRLDGEGKTTLVSREGLHWMTIDLDGRFADGPERVGPFGRRTPKGVKPALIACGSPCAMGRDGNLYCAKDHTLTIVRTRPDGHESVLVKKEQFERDWTHNMGVTAMACGPDGTLYIMGLDSFNRNEGTGEHVIWTVGMDGKIGTFAKGFVKEKLAPEQQHPEVGPAFCRGLAVDEYGDVYVSVTGNRCVMKLTAKGGGSVVHHMQKPWIPTGVAVFKGELFVLEYDDETPAAHGEWPPRVTKVGRDGKVSEVARVERKK
jgi:hypothetical protein